MISGLFRTAAKINGRDSVTTSALQDRRNIVVWYSIMRLLSIELKKWTAHLATDISHCLAVVAKRIESPVH